MKRVTEKDLENIVSRINRMTGNPESSYVRNAEGKLEPQAGNYHLSFAYGGVTLHQMCDEGTGTHDVLRCGYVSKRELQSLLFAFIDGIQVEVKKD